METKKTGIKSVAVVAIMGAIGFILMVLEFPMPFLIPPFIKFDFSELPAIITAFALGPIQGIIVCLIKNLLHLFVTTSAGVGELSNFILGAIFVGTAGIIYRYKKTRSGALIGSIVGALLMAVISVVSNYFVVYPAYVTLYGMPMEAIIGMYKALLPASDTLLKSLLIFNLPFTFAKGMIDAVICFAVYKKLSPILK
ncbi:MAG: ECF transporter S component [Acutalibacteraceae bacterium]|nr:ECF transporter S component [Acutalibacteraceae bacterium]